jgi:hypothetical protein
MEQRYAVAVVTESANLLLIPSRHGEALCEVGIAQAIKRPV